MRRTWSSSSVRQEFFHGRRLRWNQTANSSELSLVTNAQAHVVAKLQRSLTAMPEKSRHSPKFFFSGAFKLSRQRSYFYARTAAHRGRNSQLAQVHALRSRWTRFVQSFDQCSQVGLKLFDA